MLSMQCAVWTTPSPIFAFRTFLFELFYVSTFLWHPEKRKTWRIFFCFESKWAKYKKVVTPESAAAAIF